MKTVIFEVIFGKYAGNKITEQTSASDDSIKLYASALGWKVISITPAS